MLRLRPVLLTVALGALVSACEDGPTTPSPSAGYEGQWSGTTFQGRPISFTVSPDQKVTAITLGYSFGNCSGTHTFSNLNLDIARPPNPLSPQPGPGFGYGDRPAWRTRVHAN